MQYYDPNYNVTTGVPSAVPAIFVWTIISLVLAVVGGIVLYFTVFNKKKEGKYKGILGFLYDLIHFRYFVIDDIVRIAYLVGVIAITLLSFNYIGNWQFLVILIGGNLSLRLSFELIMLFMGLCHDVRDMNKKMKK